MYTVGAKTHRPSTRKHVNDTGLFWEIGF